MARDDAPRASRDREPTSRWKLPTPGTMTPCALSRSAGTAGDLHLRAHGRQRLAHRRQVARAVVDERRSQQPLRAGERARELLVARARDAERAAERLEHRFDVVMARAAVQHLHVHVAADALREPLEEIVDQLALKIADALDRESQVDDGMRAGRRGRPPRRRAPRPSA